MALLQASNTDGESSSFGAPGVGAGTDVLAELERIRSNLAALAQVVEEIRSTFNSHTHAAAVPAPPAGEQATTRYTLH